MPRWKEENKIARVEAKQPSGRKAILVLQSNPKEKRARVLLVRKEKLEE